MDITDYHGTGDGIPLRTAVAILEDDRLRFLNTDELEEIVNRYPDLEPKDTSVKGPLRFLLNPLNRSKRYQGWRLKREIKSRDCNLAYIQIGSFYVVTDFYAIPAAHFY